MKPLFDNKIMSDDDARAFATRATHRYVSLLGRVDKKFWYFATLAESYCTSTDQKKDKNRSSSFQSQVLSSFYQFLIKDDKASLELKVSVLESFLNYIDDATKGAHPQSNLPSQVFQSSHNVSVLLQEMLNQAQSVG